MLKLTVESGVLKTCCSEVQYSAEVTVLSVMYVIVLWKH